ncbi:MAG: hypothetical protein Fur0025_21560 [Oscillatoriaceae cyanobacterium]
MTIAEVLQLVDRLVEKQTGKHLNDLEKTVVKGLWEGKTYSQIADEYGYDTNYIGDISRLLFKQLSEQLDEKVTKSNFCWTIERVINSQFVGLINSNVTWCHPKTQPISNPSTPETETTNKKTGYRDLAIAPSIAHFCDRATELQTLSHWVLEQNTRLISVLGLPGIGKTTLVKRFVDLNQEDFDVVVWKSLKFSQSLDSIITDICSQANLDKSIIADNAISQLFNILSQQRCLIILDDVQELFNPGQLAGQYKSKYEDYQTLFSRLRDIAHQSCAILVSQEQSQEMFSFNDNLSPVKYLELKGLTDPSFLTSLGLSEDNSWSSLMAAYEGHPAYLKDMAILINHVFCGKISDFLAEYGLIIPADTQLQIQEFIQRLSPIEKQIILKLSQFDQPITKEELKQGLDLSSMALINGLQSLTRRYLIKIIAADTILVDLSGVFREYLRITGDK